MTKFFSLKIESHDHLFSLKEGRFRARVKKIKSEIEKADKINAQEQYKKLIFDILNQESLENYVLIRAVEAFASSLSEEATKQLVQEVLEPKISEDIPFVLRLYLIEVLLLKLSEKACEALLQPFLNKLGPINKCNLTTTDLMFIEIFLPKLPQKMCETFIQFLLKTLQNHHLLSKTFDFKPDQPPCREPNKTLAFQRSFFDLSLRLITLALPRLSEDICKALIKSVSEESNIANGGLKIINLLLSKPSKETLEETIEPLSEKLTSIETLTSHHQFKILEASSPKLSEKRHKRLIQLILDQQHDTIPSQKDINTIMMSLSKLSGEACQALIQSVLEKPQTSYESRLKIINSLLLNSSQETFDKLIQPILSKINVDHPSKEEDEVLTKIMNIIHKLSNVSHRKDIRVFSALERKVIIDLYVYRLKRKGISQEYYSKLAGFFKPSKTRSRTAKLEASTTLINQMISGGGPLCDKPPSAANNGELKSILRRLRS